MMSFLAKSVKYAGGRIMQENMQAFTIAELKSDDAARAAEIERMIFTMPWSEKGFRS